MPWLSVVRGSEQQGMPPEGLMKAMDDFIAQSFKKGALVSTGGLAPSAQGFRVRIEGGRMTVIDGPFTESKEVIGGYAVIAAATREDAIRATREFMQLHLDHWPEWQGECEVREVVFLAP